MIEPEYALELVGKNEDEISGNPGRGDLGFKGSLNLKQSQVPQW
jgi:hypothetical protein